MTRRFQVLRYVAPVAGLLAIAGGRARADDATKQGGAEGAATSEQQSRSTGKMDRAQPQSGSTEASGAAAAPGGKEKQTELAGQVQNVSSATNTLQVAGKTFKLEKSTEVTKNGAPARIADIHEGDEVRASFAGSDSVPTALKIDVVSSGAAGRSTGPGGAAPSGTGAGTSDSTGQTSGTGTSTMPSPSGSSGASEPGGSSSSTTR